MTYLLLVAGLLFVALVLYIRVRNHMRYCRRVAAKSSERHIPGCPETNENRSDTSETSIKPDTHEDKDTTTHI